MLISLYKILKIKNLILKIMHLHFIECKIVEIPSNKEYSIFISWNFSDFASDIVIRNIDGSNYPAQWLHSDCASSRARVNAKF